MFLAIKGSLPSAIQHPWLSLASLSKTLEASSLALDCLQTEENESKKSTFELRQLIVNRSFPALIYPLDQMVATHPSV
jgi:hypothetical protein